jgi:hypothetical protein
MTLSYGDITSKYQIFSRSKVTPSSVITSTINEMRQYLK